MQTEWRCSEESLNRHLFCPDVKAREGNMPWVNVQVNCSFIWNGFQSFEGGKRWWGVVQPPMLECKVFMRTAWQKKRNKTRRNAPFEMLEDEGRMVVLY